MWNHHISWKGNEALRAMEPVLIPTVVPRLGTGRDRGGEVSESEMTFALLPKL